MRQVHPSKVQKLKTELLVAVRDARVARSAAVSERAGAERAAVAAAFAPAPRESPRVVQAIATATANPAPQFVGATPAAHPRAAQPPSTTESGGTSFAQAKRACDSAMRHVAELEEVRCVSPLLRCVSCAVLALVSPLHPPPLSLSLSLSLSHCTDLSLSLSLRRHRLRQALTSMQSKRPCAPSRRRAFTHSCNAWRCTSAARELEPPPQVATSRVQSSRSSVPKLKHGGSLPPSLRLGRSRATALRRGVEIGVRRKRARKRK